MRALSYVPCCYLFLFFVAPLFHLCSSNKHFGADELCMDGERQALLRFKHGLIDKMDRLASWENGEEKDCCRWAGIGCDNSTGHIHLIHLRNQTLSGILSPSLMHLKQLRHLDLSCNDFGGIKVPKFIGSLGNLRYLNLSNSKFGGMIPPQLGNLSEVQVLCLGNFHSQIEATSMIDMHWLSGLRSLQHLDMSGVDLSKATDWLQVINTLPSLVQLHLSICELSNIHPYVPTVNLSSLSLLDLSYNYFNSPLPQWIFSITSLVSLDLSRCSLHGLNPSSIYTFRNLTSLKFLQVSGNDFMNSSSVIEDLSGVGANLITLDISFCGVSSSALDSLHNLTSLLSLDLSRNQLTKTIPKLLGNVCNLIYLDLSDNSFLNISLTYLTESFFKCKSPALKSLLLRNSGVSGNLPFQLGQLIHLEYLELVRNYISGPIPDSIGQLSSLRLLDVSDNLLSGTIPSSIGRLSLLVMLVLSYNQLNSSLPNALGQLPKLEQLRFSFNLLTGVVTETHFAKLVSLKHLNGEGNNRTLSLQVANWIPSFQVQYLNLNSWGLGPRFPLWLQSQKELHELKISNTGISSPMPHDSFWRSLPNLESLNMSQNHIQGMLFSIPENLVSLDLSSNEFRGKLPNLSNVSLPYVMHLSNNFFAGSMHPFLCSYDVKFTEILDLGRNRLSGVIPDCLEKWPGLEFLSLENNKLSCGIPRSLGSLSGLQSLNMHGNKLSGRLPPSIMNLRSLEILQLGRNELVGSIPSWFGRKLSRLRLLNFRSNNFVGKIPHEFCYLSSIQILDLADNKLSGNIPRCFNNFSVFSGKKPISGNLLEYFITDLLEDIISSDSLVMKGREDTYSTILRLVMMLDLSNNNFSGIIPSELTALVKLQSLNLSRNQLTGSIPEKIGDMKALISFDLSVNKLYGELPASLSSLNLLSSFNVSYNNIIGRVPSSTQLQSFDNSSFFGNKLCGDPLTDPCVRVEVPKTDTEDQQEDGEANWGLIVSIVLGFISGFWIVFLPLIVSKSWRIAYYHFMSELGYMVYDLMQKYCFYMFSK